MTIRIDGAGRRLDDPTARPDAREAPDTPVFVDETGRRGRRFRTAGMLLGLACAVYAWSSP
ncbi:hypothetical protein ACWCP6_15865 [Streptomyces sp. NPDC002004]